MVDVHELAQARRRCRVLARSRISLTFQVRPSVLLMPRILDRNSGRAAARPTGRSRRGPRRSSRRPGSALKPEKMFSRPGGKRMQVLDVQRGNAVAGGPGAVHRFLDRPAGRAPAHQQHVAFGRAIDFGRGQRGRQRLQLLAALGRHLHVQLGEAVGWPILVVLQAARDRVASAQDRRAGHHARASRRPARRDRKVCSRPPARSRA